MNLEGKEPVAIVRSIEKEQEQHLHYTPEDIYNQLKKECEENISKMKASSTSPNFNLNSKGRKYFLFPMLKRVGFDTWDKLDSEMKLIDERKSNVSSNVRNTINHLHTHCLITYLKLKENGNKEESI